MLDAVPHAVAVLDVAGVIEFANAAWLAAVEKGHLSGARGQEFFAAFADRGDVAEQSAVSHVLRGVRAVLSGSRHAASSQYRRKGGARVAWYQVSVRARPDRAAGAVITLEDRTEAREHYTGVVGANRVLRDVIDHLPRAALWKDREDRIVGCNEAFLDGYGVGYVGRHIGDIPWPQGVAASFRALDRLTIETGETQSSVVGVAVADGSTRWWDLASGPLKNADGSLTGTINSYIDVTEENRLREAAKRSEYRLRVALDAARMGVFDCDLTTGKTTYTDRCAQMLLYDRDDLGATMQAWAALVHPEDAGESVRRLSEHVRGQADNYTIDKRMQAKDQSWVWVRETGQIVERASDGTPLRLVGICIDITKERQSHERTRRIARRLQHATNASQIGIWEYDVASRMMTWDERMFAIYGRSARTFNPAQWLQVVHPDDHPRVRAAIDHLMSRRMPFREMFRIVRPDGSAAHLAVQGAVELSPTGEALTATGTTIDVTESHMAADAVLLAKRILEAFVEHAPAPVAMFDKSFRYLVHSRRWVELGKWGESGGSLIGKDHYDVFPDADPKWRLVVQSCCTGQTLKGTEDRLDRPDGSTVWINWEAKPWRDHKGEIGGAIIASEDVTDDIETRRQLKVANKRLHDFVATASDWLWEANAAGKMTFFSERFYETTNYAPKDLIGRSITEFSLSEIHQSNDEEEIRRLRGWTDFRDLVFQLPVKPGSKYQGPFIYIRVSGKVQTDAQGRFAGYLGTATDVTEAVHQGNAAKQAQKLQAVGTLAAGVAHEFNNILAIIRGHADLAKRALSRGEMAEEDLGHVIEAAARGSTLTRGLLAFGRKGAPSDISTFDVGDLLTEQRMFLRPLTGPQFDLVVDRSEAPALVHTKRDSFAQAVMNLVVNARDASPKGGKIVLAVDVVDAADVVSRLGTPPADGRFVRLRVTDNGVGMKEEVLQRIFEPFFTTKAVGKGTGLGLQFVYRLVADCKGYINVASTIGGGTTFTLHFPEARPAREADTAGVAVPTRYDGMAALVVDDEKALAAIYKGMLENLGFEVTACSDPEEALEAVDNFAGNLDLIVSDVLMPKLEGPQFAELASALHPEAAVLFVTGQADRGAQSAKLPKGANVLRKPFAAEDLATAIAKAFRENSTRAA